MTGFARTMGWSCVAIGSLQLIGGARVEPGVAPEPTTDSHIRFMGPMFIGYGLGWLDAAASGDVGRMRLLAGLMGAGGAGRLVTRATLGRPHWFHDVVLALELATPVITYGLTRRRTT